MTNYISFFKLLKHLRNSLLLQRIIDAIVWKMNNTIRKQTGTAQRSIAKATAATKNTTGESSEEQPFEILDPSRVDRSRALSFHISSPFFLYGSTANVLAVNECDTSRFTSVTWHWHYYLRNLARLCAPLVILSLLRPRCWRRPRVKWNGVTQSPACSWHSRPLRRTNRNRKSSEWPKIVTRASGTRMSQHDCHVFARASGTVLAQHATNEIGLEIRLSDHGHALYEL